MNRPVAVNIDIWGGPMVGFGDFDYQGFVEIG